jgi:hypothetical protein
MDSVVDIMKAIIEGKRNGKRHPEIALDREIAEIYSGNDLNGEITALLAKIKAERAGKEFIRIPLESGNGYYEIEKSKYEKRLQRQK